MIFFKCVRRIRSFKGDYYYTSTIAANQEVILYYPGEKITSPKWLADAGYYPLVFDTLKHVKIAMLTYDWELDGSIWMCEVSEKDVIKDLPSVLNTSDLDDGIITRMEYCWPTGTVMVKNLTLTTLIK